MASSSASWVRLTACTKMCAAMIRYKIDILKELKSDGFTTYRLRKGKLLSEGTMQKIREDSTGLTLEVIDRICGLLHCQPGDLIEWVPEDEG